MNLHSLRVTPDVMRQELDTARDLGAQSVRVDVNWSVLEPDTKGRFADWYLARLDALMSEAARRDLNVVLVLGATPCWASSAPEDVKQGCGSSWWERGGWRYPPSEATDYGAVAATLARRYQEGLAGIEVWNEPNLRMYFESADAPADYVRLLRSAYVRIKAAAPRVAVLGGSLSRCDASFLRRLYDEGARGYYDVLSVHPYNSGRPLGISVGEDQVATTYRQGLAQLLAVQRAARDDTPIWATEFGWSTSSTRNGPGWLNGVDEDEQAANLVDALALLDHEPLAEIGGAFVYELRDSGAVATDTEANYGLVTQDFSPKPAFAAVRALWRAGAGGDDAPPDPEAQPSGSNTTGYGLPAGNDLARPTSVSRRSGQVFVTPRLGAALPRGNRQLPVRGRTHLNGSFSLDATRGQADLSRRASADRPGFRAGVLRAALRVVEDDEHGLRLVGGVRCGPRRGPSSLHFAISGEGVTVHTRVGEITAAGSVTVRQGCSGMTVKVRRGSATVRRPRAPRAVTLKAGARRTLTRRTNKD